MLCYSILFVNFASILVLSYIIIKVVFGLFMSWVRLLKRVLFLIGCFLFAQYVDAQTFECKEGTILFKEDFGGNYVNDVPRREEALPDSVNNLKYSSHVWNLGYNAYSLRKEAIKRSGSPNPQHIYSGWYAEFGDHTYDNDLTRGYFMQIDLDYKESTFYVYRVNNLCESTQLYFSFWGHPVNTSENAPVTLTIEDTKGNVLNQEKFIINCKDNSWQQFGMTFSVPQGETSIVYRVFSGAGGNGGDFALDDIEIRLCTPPVEVDSPTDSLCMGSNYTLKANMNDVGSLVEPITYTWYKNTEKNYNNDGWVEIATGSELPIKNITKKDEGYYKVVATSAGTTGEYTMCGSFSDIVPLMVKKCEIDTVIYDTVCYGATYIFGEDVLDETGIYEKTFKNVVGYDSIVRLDLTVLDLIYTEIQDEIFSGSSYVFGTQVLTKSGTYTETFTSVSGCDSIVKLELIVKENPIKDCQYGTVLFKEDFGGNYVSDPDLGPALPAGKSSLPFSNHVWERLKNGYDIRKEAIKRRDSNPRGHVYAGWYADFGDHTYDGDLTRGYFMIIDLDYLESTFYKAQVNDLCESTQLYFSFWGHPVNASENAPVTLTIEDTKGNILNQEKFIIDSSNDAWQQFGMPFEVPAGETSIVYRIFSGAGGNGGDFALDDIEIHLCTPPVDVSYPEDSLCLGSEYTLKASMSDIGSLVEPITYTWFKNKEKNYNNEGWVKIATGSELPVKNITKDDEGYYKVIATSAGAVGEYNMCESFSDIVPLMVKECNVDTVVYDTICYGETYTFEGEVFDKSGDYEKTLKNIEGYDSTVILKLTVLDPIRTEQQETICEGTSYSFGSQVLTQSGTYTETFTSVNGCDSVVTLNLKLTEGYSVELEEVIYKGEFYQFGNEMLTISGVYEKQFTSVGGCDSIVKLTLKVVEDNIETSLQETICEGEYYQFGQEKLTQSGVYTKTFTGVSGGDSTVTLELTVAYPSEMILKDTLKNGNVYQLNGFNLYNLTNGESKYMLRLENQYGCDSVVTLYLYVDNIREYLPIIPAEYMSPDGNGIRDTWEVENLNTYPQFIVRIYNRFGKLLAEYLNDYPGWDATYMGHPVPSEDYWYEISIEGSDKEYVGHFTVLRR